jgi:hypothetical protein
VNVAARINEAYAHRAPQPIAPQAIALDHVNRYVWYPAEDIPYPEANAGYVALLRERARQLGMQDIALAGGYVERNRVTPILPNPVWERYQDVPEDLRRATRGRMPNGDPEEALYYVPPGHIFDGLMDGYRFYGVTEIEALRGMDIEDFLALRIDEIFFPEEKDLTRLGPDQKPIDRTPRRYSEIRTQIMQALKTQKDSAQYELYKMIAADMIRAVEVSEAFDTSLVDEEESRNPLRYTNHGLRALYRLQRQRRDHAINDMAKRQDAAVDVIAQLPTAIAQAQGGGIGEEALTRILAAQEARHAEMMAAAEARYVDLLAKFAAPAAAQPSEAPKPVAGNQRNRN